MLLKYLFKLNFYHIFPKKKRREQKTIMIIMIANMSFISVFFSCTEIIHETFHFVNWKLIVYNFHFISLFSFWILYKFIFCLFFWEMHRKSAHFLNKQKLFISCGIMKMRRKTNKTCDGFLEVFGRHLGCEWWL